MFKTKRNIVLALAVCALLVPATASVKNPVTRPFKHQAKASIMFDFSQAFDENWNAINPIVPWWVEWQSGEATHLA